MTSTKVESDPTGSTGLGLGNAFGVGSVLATLGSLGYISLNSVDSSREAFAHPLGIVSGIVATIGIVTLALALMRWRTSLPGWAVVTAAAGLVFTAAATWFFSIGIVAVAEHTDDELFKTIATSTWIWVLTGPKMVLCLVAFAAMAVSGWRSRAIPRTACVAFGLAAIVSVFPPHPPGLLLACVAFFLISRKTPASRS